MSPVTSPKTWQRHPKADINHCCQDLSALGSIRRINAEFQQFIVGL